MYKDLYKYITKQSQLAQFREATSQFCYSHKMGFVFASPSRLIENVKHSMDKTVESDLKDKLFNILPEELLNKKIATMNDLPYFGFKKRLLKEFTKEELFELYKNHYAYKYEKNKSMSFGEDIEDFKHESFVEYLIVDIKVPEKGDFYLEYADHTEWFLSLFLKLTDKVTTSGFSSLSDYEPLFKELVKQYGQRIKMYSTQLGMVVRVGRVYYYGSDYQAEYFVNEEDALVRFGFLNEINQELNHSWFKSKRYGSVILQDYDNFDFNLHSVQSLNAKMKDWGQVKSLDAFLSLMKVNKIDLSVFAQDNFKVIETHLRHLEKNNYNCLGLTGYSLKDLFYKDIWVRANSELLRINYQDRDVRIEKNTDYYFLQSISRSATINRKAIDELSREEYEYMLISDKGEIIRHKSRKSLFWFEQEMVDALGEYLD